jgi:hypothetical protein
MKKIIKSKFLFYESNTCNYGQLLLNNNVILTVKSDLFNNKIHLTKLNILEKLYNDKLISYTTLIFILYKNNKVINYKSDLYFLQVLIEFGWESGTLFKNKKKYEKIIFFKK